MRAARAATDKYHKLSTAKAAGFTKLVDQDGYRLPAFYSLHAWIWYANPSGMFTMWNPAGALPATRRPA